MKVFLIILGFLGCFLIGKYTSPPQTLESEKEEGQETQKSFAPLMENIQSFDKDRLKGLSDDEKLKQARAFYEKSFKLFLAAIGYRHLTHKAKSQQTPLKVAQSSPPSSQDQSPQATPMTDTEERGFYDPEDIPDAQKMQKTVDQKKSEKIFSKSGKLKNPKLYFYNTSYMTTVHHPLYQKVLGQFRGKMRVFEEEELHNVELKIDYVYDPEKKDLRGNSEVILSSTEKGVYSHKTGNGGNGTLMAHPNTPGWIIIKASPSSYLHLKWSQKKKGFWGHFYDTEGNQKKLKLTGKVLWLKPS